MMPTASPQPGGGRRKENLALAFQEILTVSARLRSGRQTVTDAASFRHNIMEGLKIADQQARAQGYNGEDIKLAIFAVVAFVDESILNLRHPAFADWPRRPLQEELFGHHIAGEVFFKNLQELLASTESQDLADVLEVYQLCLLLGFAGRYSLGGRGELKAIIDATAAKIQRIRGGAGPLSPVWALPLEAKRQAGSDPLVKTLGIVAAACLALTLLLLVVYKLVLGSGVSSLGELAGVVR
ncbi:MAG: DotU family type IV/VI secretion system protein [Acidobacteriales bacterium]|nr:DotU family type IV/VI secretion system protein [Terriglobales bacterium]